MTFAPKFTITNRQTAAIIRIERAPSAWRRSGGGYVGDNFATGFAIAGCDIAQTSSVTDWNVLRQIAIRISTFQTAMEAI